MWLHIALEVFIEMWIRCTTYISVNSPCLQANASFLTGLSGPRAVRTASRGGGRWVPDANPQPKIFKTMIYNFQVLKDVRKTLCQKKALQTNKC